VPTLVTEVMAQRDLVKTEFFNDFLDRDGLYHGVNLHAFDKQRHIGDLRIWRHRRRPAFQKDATDLLTMLNPALTASLGRRRAKQAAPAVSLRETPSPSPLLSSGLSTREAEVAERVCRGYSDKEIAAELKIGFATVRSHLDHVFRKLGVRTRTQLIARFRT
jgi:DNA-binding CsgD family transcriptional regulator